jgi:hypothetical protein
MDPAFNSTVFRLSSNSSAKLSLIQISLRQRLH